MATQSRGLHRIDCNGIRCRRAATRAPRGSCTHSPRRSDILRAEWTIGFTKLTSRSHHQLSSGLHTPNVSVSNISAAPSSLSAPISIPLPGASLLNIAPTPAAAIHWTADSARSRGSKPNPPDQFSVQAARAGAGAQFYAHIASGEAPLETY